MNSGTRRISSDDFSFEASIAGQEVIRRLETTFAQWLGVRYAVSTSSCTFALHIALKAGGVQFGDEVIVPAYDWFAATAAVLHCGAIPIFADVDKRTYTIDPNSVSERISPKTKAIIATHLYGHPADMPALRKLANAYGILLIEDAAQALGAVCAGKKVGTWGDLACFSFGVGKILSCGEGGLIVTNNETLFEKVVALCQHPLRHQWEGISSNPFALKSTINPLAAAYLLEQLSELEKRLTERQNAFRKLNEVLTETEVLHPVFIRDGCVHGCYRFSPTVTNGKQRDDVMMALIKAGIPAHTGLLAEPLPKVLHRALKEGQLSWHPFPEQLIVSSNLPCSVAQQLCQTTITLDWQLGRTAEGLMRLREALLLTAKHSKRKIFGGEQRRRCFLKSKP